LEAGSRASGSPFTFSAYQILGLRPEADGLLLRGAGRQAGTLGAAAVGAAVAAHVLALAGWEHLAAAGAIAAISEALPVPGVGRGAAMMDDNLVIPVVSGALLTACRLGP